MKHKTVNRGSKDSRYKLIVLRNTGQPTPQCLARRFKSRLKTPEQACPSTFIVGNPKLKDVEHGMEWCLRAHVASIASKTCLLPRRIASRGSNEVYNTMDIKIACKYQK